MDPIPPPRINTSLLAYPKSDYPASFIKNHLADILSQFSESKLCFTDGSKTQSSYVGYAFSIDNITFSFQLPSFSSIFTAELSAIFHCLHHISLSTEHSHYTILTDSISSLLSIQNIFSEHPIVQKIQSIVHSLTLINIEIQFLFIPSHIGIPGNERVDQSAKTATTSSPITTQVIQDVKNFLRQKTRLAWQTDWSSQLNNKLLSYKKSVTPWKILALMNRREAVAITRLRIGHTRITHEHLYHGHRETPLCEFCNSFPISVSHLLFFCPTLHNNRLLSGISPNDLATDDASCYGRIVSFLRRSGLVNRI